MRATGLPARVSLGFIAGAVSVLVFHQGAWALLYFAKLMPPPYPVASLPPYGVPQIVDFCFWGGIWGAAYGCVAPRLSIPYWLSGLLLGLVAALAYWLVVLPLKGQPFAGGWVWQSMLIVLAIQLPWGFGTGVILSLFRIR